MRRLLIATKNAHKTAEIRAMLGGEWEVVDMTGFPHIPAPDETGATFEENARIKATAVSQAFPGLVLSDDSGLEVDALGGDPGVHSATYAGEHGNDAANRARLRREITDRDLMEPCTARFRCVMAVAENGKVLRTFDGRVEGQVISVERGEGGFGYDSMFVPDGYEETFGELSADVKNSLSHRARALAKASDFLKTLV